MTRFDAIGMFWQDMPTSRKRSEQDRPRPPVPETGWRAPSYFPDLSSAIALSIDTETRDPELLSSGPGWARGRGHVVGFSVGAKDKHGNVGQWYFPIRHADTPEDNLDPDNALAWLKHTLSRADQPKIGANLPYDLGWLAHEGIPVAGPLYDVQFAEALLDERAKVALDVLGLKYLREGKQGNELYQWCSDAFGGQANDRQRKNIWRAPPSLVGPYAEQDAALPLRIIGHQWEQLAKENLLDVFHMECQLIPLFMEMRFAGVTVDVPRAEELYDTLGKEVLALEENLRQAVGFRVNVNSGDDLARAFDAMQIPYMRTAPTERSPKGNPTFTAAFLSSVKDPVAQLIVDIRQREKIRGTFIKSYILDNQVNGKVHGTFNQLRGDEGGTRSGRLSSDTPNLQNIPVRTELGKMIRRIFTYDEGHVAWRKYDYSQIEYRFLAHFAVDTGDGSANRLRAFYENDPDIDYHKITQKLVKEMTGLDLPRGHTKTINFGLIYGMGEPKLAQDLGVSLKLGKEMFAAYHKGAPYARATMNACSAEAARFGTITTILGRKSRFELWEPDERTGRGERKPALPYEQAHSRYFGNVKRAYTHKALNRRLQGSAADQMKKAMLQCYQDGIFAETGVPRLTVHDELDFSDPGGKDEAFRAMRHVMETCMKLRVPVKADYEIGDNWGDVKAPR